MVVVGFNIQCNILYKISLAVTIEILSLISLHGVFSVHDLCSQRMFFQHVSSYTAKLSQSLSPQRTLVVPRNKSPCKL